MAILKNTTITGTGSLTLPAKTISERVETRSVVQSFTTVGTTSWQAPAGVTSVEVLVVAGGGGGGGGFDTWAGGGGGGAGGLIYRSNYPVTPNSNYTVTVGAGGAGGIGSNSPRYGASGGNSVFDSLTAVGGSGGNAWNSSTGSTAPQGGSGGGGQNSSGPFTGALGTAGQGHDGGPGMSYSGTNQSSAGGGGGAGGVGGGPTVATGGSGGEGLAFDITGNIVIYAAGGGGGGGQFGGGSENGGFGGNGTGSNGTSANANTGGGGGGAGSTVNPNGTTTGGAGGSGIVVIRYTIPVDGDDIKGETNYNTQINDVEVFDNYNQKWTAQDQSKNYAGHNLIPWSESFTSSPWALTNAGITGSAGIAPDGTNTASKLTENTATSSHGVLVNQTMISNARYTISVFAKAAERSWLAIRADNQTNWNYYNLATGALGTTSTVNATTAGIQSYGNGWYRCFMSYTAGGTGNDPEIYVAQSDGVVSYAGTNGSGILIWGAQLELNEATPTPYTKTEGAFAPTPVTLGDFRIHTYTEVGSCSFVPAYSGNVEVLVVAGGGGAGTDVGGGGGGGGVVYNESFNVVSGKRYKVTVGGGGGAGSGAVGGTGGNGGNSVFGTIVAIGGGGGGFYYAQMGYNGGSGGGQGGAGPNNSALVAGTTQGGTGTVGQGYPGGIRRAGFGGGGGGGAGGPGHDQFGYGADGGPGVAYDISGTLTYYGGGGGAGDSGSVDQIGWGGIGGGGDGDSRNLNTSFLQISGRPNTGGGGGADGGFTQSGSGGSGIVIVRYKI